MAEKQAAARAAAKNEVQTINADLLTMNGTEEDKINAMMKQSTMDYDPHKWVNCFIELRHILLMQSKDTRI